MRMPTRTAGIPSRMNLGVRFGPDCLPDHCTTYSHCQPYRPALPLMKDTPVAMRPPKALPVSGPVPVHWNKKLTQRRRWTQQRWPFESPARRVCTRNRGNTSLPAVTLVNELPQRSNASTHEEPGFSDTDEDSANDQARIGRHSGGADGHWLSVLPSGHVSLGLPIPHDTMIREIHLDGVKNFILKNQPCHPRVRVESCSRDIGWELEEDIRARR